MKKFSVAALAVSIIALVAAISGVAGASPKPSHKAHAASQRGPRGKRGPRGHTGRTGPQGPAGAIGATGAAGSFSAANVVQVTGPVTTMSDSSGTGIGDSLATCPAGAVILSGGWDGLTSPPTNSTVAYSKPYGTNSWGVIMADDGDPFATFEAVAICATTGVGAARDARSGQARQAFLNDVAAFKRRIH